MRLLILTQKVDKNDDVLGFFHRWLEGFAKYYEKILVVCLYEGEHSLPRNVRIESLGKEKGTSKLGYVMKFYKNIISNRKEYDSVFIHMNSEYLFLGGLLWKLMNKNVYLWYNHPKGSAFLRTSHVFAKNILSTSKYAFPTRWKKTILMPAGIDTDRFRNINQDRGENTILFLGRISPVKHVHDLAPALRILKEEGISFKANVYGDAPPQDKEYKNRWAESVSDLVESGHLEIHPSVPNHKTPEIYNKHKVYVNLTPSGSFDKTILEAMSCGSIPVIVNKSFEGILNKEQICKEADAVELAFKIKSIFNMTQGEISRIQIAEQKNVNKEQSLEALLDKFMNMVFKL